MTRANIVFKSRSERERERENDLLKNYREIGIAAIAAAAHVSCRKDKGAEPKRKAANGSHTD
ncbi:MULTISPECIES: hypothetical protein [unclassified Aureimonas]|uniref:hypothetical protein n=1 Tax=unclassified Aureimonas TaxID=2615206 RepID=UPI0007224F67|nr:MULTISPECIES: hypothetical protein [unclassified Aureimonas]ALN73691.1 hypothetical protein M673_13260 [Aureimonas sp. AU20]